MDIRPATEADTPAVLRLSNGTLVANWLQSTDPDVEASNLQLSYSTDDGKTWAKPFLPHHDGTKTQHAFAALFETDVATANVTTTTAITKPM